MSNAAPRHFRAWLVNDASSLTGPNMDVTVIEDEAISCKVSEDGAETPVWGSRVGEPEFHAVTGVNAKDGDIEDAVREVKGLLNNAGWRIVGKWQVTDNAYTATVERD